jgi:hypothetical protein
VQFFVVSFDLFVQLLDLIAEFPGFLDGFIRGFTVALGFTNFL